MSQTCCTPEWVTYQDVGLQCVDTNGQGPDPPVSYTLWRPTRELERGRSLTNVLRSKSGRLRYILCSPITRPKGHPRCKRTPYQLPCVTALLHTRVFSHLCDWNYYWKLTHLPVAACLFQNPDLNQKSTAQITSDTYLGKTGDCDPLCWRKNSHCTPAKNSKQSPLRSGTKISSPIALGLAGWLLK